MNAQEFGGWLFRHRSFVPIPGLLLLLAFPDPQFSSVVLGLSLCGLGEGVRLWAVSVIGPGSRRRDETVNGLVVSGPYDLTRNPIYIGNLVIWGGLFTVAGRGFLGALWLVAMAVHYHNIVLWEEKTLSSSLGQEYDTYRSEVPRWFPRGVKSPTIDGALNEAITSEKSTFIALGCVLLALALRVAL